MQLEEQLLETGMSLESQHSLLQIVSLMVNRVRDRKHGCTLVIDTAQELLTMSGQHFETPLDLQESSQLKLACSLAKLDGACIWMRAASNFTGSGVLWTAALCRVKPGPRGTFQFRSQIYGRA